MGRPLTKLHRAHYLSPSDSLKYVQVPHQVPSRLDPCPKRMTVQDFVAKTPPKQRQIQPKLPAASQYTGIILQAIRQYAQIKVFALSPVRHFTARQSRLYSPGRNGSARHVTPFGALKDKCIQTH